MSAFMQWQLTSPRMIYQESKDKSFQDLISETTLHKFCISLVIRSESSHHGQRRVGYSPWDHKESDTTVRLSLLTLRSESQGPAHP